MNNDYPQPPIYPQIPSAPPALDFPTITIPNTLIDNNAQNIWNRENEITFKNIADIAKEYSYIHEKMAQQGSLRGTVVNVILSIFGALTGTGGIVDLIACEDYNNYRPFRIVEVVLGFCITIVSIIASIFRFSESQKDNVIAQASYNSIIHEIKYILTVPLRERRPPQEHLQYILNEMEHIKLLAPAIDERIKTKYESRVDSRSLRDKFRNVAKMSIILNRIRAPTDFRHLV